MKLIDRGLSWLWRVVLMAGLTIGILIPPMLLRIINQLNHRNTMLAWQIILVITYFVIFILLIFAASATMRHYTGQYQNQRLHRSDWGIIISGYLTILIFETVFQLINQQIYHQSQTQNNQAIKTLMNGSPLSLWMMAISAVFLTPIVEELVFRGVLTNLFFKQEWLKIALSGLVFGSLHSSSTIPSFLIYVTMGLVLATVYRLTGKIHASIALHFLINALAMTLLLTH